ncbi:MAG TPA: UV DNA damage repair endonuclease UvsE [Chloroflexia bacterium]|nr:UV DNA damage repair endonuclease UvsE [Chloroflexia bacterium]
MLEQQPGNNHSSNPVRPHLGLVCITASDRVRFRTITRTRYLKLGEAEKRATLRDIYSDNLRRLDGAVAFCQRQGIRLYRISSALFPMSDLPGDETGGQVLEELRPQMAAIGNHIAEVGLRVVMHPDQFVVLNSESAQIVQTSIRVMERHAGVLDMLGLPRTAWTAMTLHGGKGGRSDQLVETIGTLPANIRNRLTLENDERAYGAADILDICRRAGVPMVFDVHHHICHDGLTSLEDPSIGEYLQAARETWPDPAWQLVHLSNGRDAFADPAHHDFITSVPSAYRQVPWIEVEAKAKEQAIDRLRIDWPLAD